MIDIRDEQLFPLRLVPRHPNIPARRSGRPFHLSTVIRWAKTGVRGVRLEALRVGGTLCTSEQALQRFFERLARPGPSPRTSPALPADATQVERELDRISASLLGLHSASREFKAPPGGVAEHEFLVKPVGRPDQPLLVWLAATGREPPDGVTISLPDGSPQAVPGWVQTPEGVWRTPPLHCPLTGVDRKVVDPKVVVRVPNPGPEEASYDLDLVWRTNPHAVHLHVMTIGVTRYGPEGGVNDLPFAEADARDLTAAFRHLEGPLFTRVRAMDPLVNGEATAEAIRQHLKKFRAQVLEDTAVPLKLAAIALSGHGAIYDDRHFFFMPSDYNPAVLSTHLYWHDIETFLGDVGCHTVLLLDTCHSGQAAFQSAVHRAAMGGTARSAPTDDALERAITEFGEERPGLFVLAAADSKGRAWENDKYRHGAMTQAVLDVLRGEAPPVGGGVVTLEDLLAHVRVRVKEMARSQDVTQHVVPGFAPGRRPEAIPIAYFHPAARPAGPVK